MLISDKSFTKFHHTGMLQYNNYQLFVLPKNSIIGQFKGK